MFVIAWHIDYESRINYKAMAAATGGGIGESSEMWSIGKNVKVK